MRFEPTPSNHETSSPSPTTRPDFRPSEKIWLVEYGRKLREFLEICFMTHESLEQGWATIFHIGSLESRIHVKYAVMLT